MSKPQWMILQEQLDEGVEKLREENRTLRQKVAELEERINSDLQELLRELQWAGDGVNSETTPCFICGGYDPENINNYDLEDVRIGHADDCRLAKELSDGV